MDVYNKNTGSSISSPPSIYGLFKKPFKWEWESAKVTKTGTTTSMNKEDEKKYSSCTITATRVAGEYNKCDYVRTVASS
jgi:hypothetical protein